MKDFLKYDKIEESLGYHLARCFFANEYLLLEAFKRNGYNDLTPPQMGILLKLKEQDGISQTELATQLIKHKASVTRMIDLLLKGDYVTRVQDKDDRRKHNIFLTEKGAEAADKLRLITYKQLEKAFHNFTEEEVMILKTLLKKLYNNV